LEPIWGFLVQQLIRQPCMILGGVGVKTYARIGVIFEIFAGILIFGSTLCSASM